MTIRRVLFWSVALLLLALGLLIAFSPRPVHTDLVTVRSGPMVFALTEKGKTRIREIFTVSAPVGGRIRRIELEPGAEIVAGETLIAEIEPADPTFLDRRTEAEARAAVDTAKAALSFARAQQVEAQAELDFAAGEFERTRKLRASNTVAQRTLDNAERLFRARQASLSTAQAAVRMRLSELEAAEMRLLRPTERPPDRICPCLPIHAPVSGVLLRVLQRSAGVVQAGTPLVEIGDPADLEVVADFLSMDAVRIEPGQKVIVDRWGGDERLQAVVTRVEPFGFTEVSALGIEEQRVSVVIDPDKRSEGWSQLGHGFEVEVRVVLWEADAVLKLPLTALFRDHGSWAVFTVEDGRAQRRRVRIGHRTDLEAELTGGIDEGAHVIRYPSSAIAEGALIAMP